MTWITSMWSAQHTKGVQILWPTILVVGSPNSIPAQEMWEKFWNQRRNQLDRQNATLAAGRAGALGRGGEGRGGGGKQPWTSPPQSWRHSLTPPFPLSIRFIHNDELRKGAKDVALDQLWPGYPNNPYFYPNLFFLLHMFI